MCHYMFLSCMEVWLWSCDLIDMEICLQADCLAMAASAGFTVLALSTHVTICMKMIDSISNP